MTRHESRAYENGKLSRLMGQRLITPEERYYRVTDKRRRIFVAFAKGYRAMDAQLSVSQVKDSQ